MLGDVVLSGVLLSSHTTHAVVVVLTLLAWLLFAHSVRKAKRLPTIYRGRLVPPRKKATFWHGILLAPALAFILSRSALSPILERLVLCAAIFVAGLALLLDWVTNQYKKLLVRRYGYNDKDDSHSNTTLIEG